MTKEAINILLCSLLFTHNPTEPLVLDIRIRPFCASIVEQLSEGAVCTLDFRVKWTMNPQRIVIDTQAQPTCLAFGHKVRQRHGTIVGHISRGVFCLHGDEAISAHHIVAVRFQVGCHPIDYLIPLSFGKVHVIAADTGFLLFVGIFIDTPV